MSVEALAILNGIENPNLIYTGQELVMTADKNVVDSCNSNIKSFATSLDNLNTSVQSLSLDGIISDDGGHFDEEFQAIKRKLGSNITTILEDADAYSKWLTELSTALDDTELYATNVIDSEIMFSNPTGF